MAVGEAAVRSDGHQESLPSAVLNDGRGVRWMSKQSTSRAAAVGIDGRQEPWPLTCGGRRSSAVGSEGRQEPWPSGARTSGAACGGCRSLRRQEQRPLGSSAVSSRGRRARRTSEQWSSGALTVTIDGHPEQGPTNAASIPCGIRRGRWPSGAGPTSGERHARRGSGAARARHSVWWSPSVTCAQGQARRVVDQAQVRAMANITWKQSIKL
jgi:hypothetical protein